jgi:ribosomal protein S27AE
MSMLRTCPDCGGILESTHPAWRDMIEIDATEEAGSSEPVRWHCLLCGYQEGEETVD